MDLADDFLDWFFMSNFGQPCGYWRNLPEDKIEALITLQNDKERKYWENWQEILKKLFGNG